MLKISLVRIAIVIFLVIGVLIGFLTSLFFNKSSNLNLPNSKLSTALPINPDRTGVRSIIAVYSFFGKVTRIEDKGSDTKFTLDISDSYTPEFVTNSYTRFFKTTGKPNTAPDNIDVKEIKLGDYLDISMSYNVKMQSWNMNALTLQATPLTSPK